MSASGMSDSLGARVAGVLPVADLGLLIDALIARGYQVVGPTVRDGAIALDAIHSAADLPAGWTDRQEAGTYRLARRDDGALFGHVAGPQGWKRYLHPPAVRLFRATRAGSGFAITSGEEVPPRLAFLGVRPCDLAAIARLDRVLGGSQFVDPGYVARRAAVFVVAVQCAEAGGTCFCVSMATGPRAVAGFDLALTERVEPDRHEFLVEVGSSRGAEVVATLRLRRADDGDVAAALAATDRAMATQGRALDTAGLGELLDAAAAGPHWAQVERRCLACANCTMVCPTCFCTTVEDTTDLEGDHAERWRRWDSCFTAGFSYIHGGSVRRSTASRYRQWMTHKLASWVDQFGELGCVGCGRCITWCPVGIDITGEVGALRGAMGPARPGGG